LTNKFSAFATAK